MVTLLCHGYHPALPAPNPVQHQDAKNLIGVLAVLDNVILGGNLDQWTTSKTADRFMQQGLRAADHDQHDLRQATWLPSSVLLSCLAVPGPAAVHRWQTGCR